MKKKKSVSEKIIDALQEFAEVLESGEPLEDHFRITTIEQVNSLEKVITTKGPKKKKKRPN